MQWVPVDHFSLLSRLIIPNSVTWRLFTKKVTKDYKQITEFVASLRGHNRSSISGFLKTQLQIFNGTLTEFSYELNTKAIGLKKDLPKNADIGKMSYNWSIVAKATSSPKRSYCLDIHAVLPFQNCLATLQRYYVNSSWQRVWYWQWLEYVHPAEVHSFNEL